MRTKNSIKNTISITIQYTITVIIGFISRTVFIKTLGSEYLGLNGLFNNILTMLSIAELGIGNAIIYNLYKPVAENDNIKIKKLMNFYKKSYNIIAISILLLGIFISFFVEKIVGEVTVDINIKVIFILSLLSVVVSYILSYKRSIIFANQKNYIINYTTLICNIVLNILQIWILIYTKNYYFYLTIKIIVQLIENYILSKIADKMYPFLKNNKDYKLEKIEEKKIFKKVKALLYHQVGTIMINGTDNIIISMFLDVKVVGLYSNYYMIINYVSMFVAQIINSSAASVGNLIACEDNEKRFDVFKKIRFLDFSITLFCGTLIFTLIQPFIKLWLGNDYLLSIGTIFIITINFFQTLMKRSYAIFKDGAGIWVEDKYVPIIESITNIISSIILVNFLGLFGVFLGTFLSGLILWLYSYPKFVYKKLFNRNIKSYYKETIGYFSTYVIIITLLYFIMNAVYVNNLAFLICIRIMITLVFVSFIYYILFRKNSNYRYIIDLLKKTFHLKKSKL